MFHSPFFVLVTTPILKTIKQTFLPVIATIGLLNGKKVFYHTAALSFLSAKSIFVDK